MKNITSSLFIIAASTVIYRNITNWTVNEVGLNLHLFDHSKTLLIAIRIRTPDLLIIELPLADTDGLELYQRILAYHVKPKTIVVTEKGDIVSATRAIRLGAMDVIEKPASNERLLRAIMNSTSQVIDQR